MTRGLGNRGQGMHWIRDEKRRAIYARDNYRCVWCDCVPSVYCLDHLIPRGPDGRGDNGSHNLVTSCIPCNSSRKDRSAVEFAFAEFSDPYAVLDRVERAIANPVERRRSDVRCKAAG